MICFHGPGVQDWSGPSLNKVVRTQFIVTLNTQHQISYLHQLTKTTVVRYSAIKDFQSAINVQVLHENNTEKMSNFGIETDQKALDAFTTNEELSLFSNISKYMKT